MVKKLKAWQLHYQKLLNVEFPWNASNLSDKPPLEVPGIKITTKVINKMKAGKAAGPSGIIIIEMIKAANNGIIDCVASLFNYIVCEGRVPNDWHLSYIINLFKEKGDALSCGNYRLKKLCDESSRAYQYNYSGTSIY